MTQLIQVCKYFCNSRKRFKFLYLALIYNLAILNAQHLVEKENQWNVAIYPTFTPDFHSYAIKILDDTLVNGLVYHKVYYSYDSINTVWNYRYGFIREDTLKRVYYKRDHDNEVLLYDFNLNVNDTFKIDEFCTLQVVEIDSISLNDGQTRKRLKLVRKGEPGWGHEYWIDGIGSQFGLINHFGFCVTDYSDVLLCFYNNNKLLFPMAPASCFLTKNDEASNEPRIKLFPNPFHSYIEFENSNSQFRSFKLTTLTGKVMLNGRFEDAGSKINTEALIYGIYLFIVEAENGKQCVSRLIKY
ncbi:MAG: T9SS type A sorting domain-containing protein [Saprospiraceae bacterium]|jgi:hypothetical protein